MRDYLCNRLFDLPESGVDAYLLQLVYISQNHPGGWAAVVLLATPHTCKSLFAG